MPRARTDPHISFAAYRDYLRAVRYVLAREYGEGPDQLPALSAAIDQRPACQHIRPLTHARPDRLAGLITIAWQTEVALNLPRLMKDEEFAALSIHWGTIQLYYAIYSAASAWLEAMLGESAPKDHRKVLNVLADYATNRAMFPLPWGAACGSCSPVAYCGETQGYQPQYVNPLSSPDYENALDLLCLSLKTTREQELEKRIADWKHQHHKKRIPRAERERLDQRLAPTTVFDFLRRLRVRANYVDAELFLAGSEYEGDASRFHESLCRIGRASLLLFEKLLAKAYGRGNMARLADDFLNKSRYGGSTLGERRPYW